MKNNLINKATRSVNKVGFKLKKHSPEILIVSGVVGVVASAVMACKATLKANEVLDEAKDTVDTIHNLAEENDKYDYTDEDRKKDLIAVYAQTGIKLVKLYGPSVVLGTLSISSILASNNILRKRNVALAAAYATVDNGFKEYRRRVIERFGERIDHELKHNVKAVEIQETVVDKDGKESVVTRKVDVFDGTSEHNTYSRIFDVGCKNWEKDPEYNKTFLLACQCQANDKLKAQGFLFLNDVYKMLGIPLSKAGQVVGWLYDENNPIGDNYVDFGIYETFNSDFINGCERSIWLDFNVDGNIWERM